MFEIKTVFFFYFFSLKMNELRTPIAADTVMVVNASNGNLIQNWGSNLCVQIVSNDFFLSFL